MRSLGKAKLATSVLLRAATSQYDKALEKHLSRARLTTQQFTVLEAVSALPKRQREIGTATAIDRSTLSTIVHHLIARGLLKSEQAKIDSRAQTVRLTKAGRGALQRARSAREMADADMIGRIGAERADDFLEALARISNVSAAP